MEEATWNNYLAKTWNQYLPPIRPYASELNIIKKYVHEAVLDYNGTKPKILILGSTPEFRDVVYDYGIIPTVVDYDKNNYLAMSQLLRKKGKDIFVESNWLFMKDLLPEKQYDLILSEAAFNVLSKENACKLYQLCKSLLSSKGKLLTKQWIRFSDKRPDFIKLVEEFRNSHNSYGFYSHTCIPLMLCYYSMENEAITLRELDKNVRKEYENGRIDENEWYSVGVHDYQNVDLVLYIPRINDFLEAMKENGLDLCAMHQITAPNSEYHPIFVYERR